MRPLPDHTKLEVDPDGLEVLRAIPGPISPVVVIGPYRSGKSFLLNQLMGVSCGESRESGRGGAFGQQDGVAAPPAVAGSVPCALACRVPGWKRRSLLRPCWEVPWQHTHTHTRTNARTHTRVRLQMRDLVWATAGKRRPRASGSGANPSSSTPGRTVLS